MARRDERKGSRGAREDRKGDGIGAILEEVINRCESKIDLFCSGSRTRCPRAFSLSLSLCPSLVYIRSSPSLPRSSDVPPRHRSHPPECRGRYREGVEPGTYREEPSRDISIATRLRVRDKPDPHSAGCRSRPSTVQRSLVLSASFTASSLNTLTEE